MDERKERNEMRKIALEHEAWRLAEEPRMEPPTRELVERFRECPDTHMDSDVFAELCERICESNTIYPAFYLVFPYLVEIAMGQPPAQAGELWEWMGAWISESYQPYAAGMPREVMEVYRESLSVAETAVLDYICRCGFSSHRGSIHYLSGAPFAFVKPEFGYLSTMSDTELWEEASCPNGHTETYTIRKKGIADSSNRRISMQETAWEEVGRLIGKMPARHPNPWTRLLPVVNGLEDCREKQMAEAACRKGISRETPFPVAVFLYLYLLQNMGRAGEDAEFSQLCRRMFDRISCPACGVQFIFMDGWLHSFESE